MRTFSIHQVRNVLIAIAVIVLASATYLASSTPLRAPSAEAGSGDNITGWAWSENVGWISLNNLTDKSATSYGVSVDTLNKATGGTGNFSGYAWSENVGWISFRRADTGNPPSAPFNTGIATDPIAQVNWATGAVTGWARVLSTSGGWDGWIKLAKDPADAGTSYGVKIFGGKFSGYAWGGDVMGWIDFAPTINGIPLGTEVATPCVVPTGYGDPAATWGSCQPVATCDGVTYVAGQSYSGVAAVSVGICNIGGGTTVQSCPSGATLVCPAAVTSTSTSKTHWWQF